MQSQLEAALLGQGNSVSINVAEREDRNVRNDDGEEEDCNDEDCREGEQKNDKNHSNNGLSRTVTLQMLLAAGILEPAEGALTIEYLGQKFVGDLLDDGKIRSQETDIIFASPSAWAVACKRFINPDKKSGCGWASVRYKGKKLDAYKNIWYKKKNYRDKEQSEELGHLQRKTAESEKVELLIKDINSAEQQEQNASNLTNMAGLHMQRMVVKHNTIANRTFTHDANTMVECVPFSNLGKIQPFLLSLSTNAALLMDFHCHLTKSEVSGYLAGHWDVNGHNLQITHAFPCRNTKADRENGPQVETEIAKAIDRERLILVGWYHSHPFTAAAPTLRDIDAQLDYQIRMKGPSDNTYTPCVGIIISPYGYESTSLESSIIAYWVIPPPETKPNEYGRPMLMSYSVVQDSNVPANLKEEMRKCVEYYLKEQDFINFSDKFYGNTSFGDKLKSTLTSKFPREQSDSSIWNYIKDILNITSEEKDSLLSIPSVSKSSQMMMNLTPPVSLNSNLMLTSDIASVLFNSGKFPSATSLLGLPDPMAHSTLAANNMFLQSNIFKMQELLKPLSTSSPLPPSKPKSDLKMPSTLKIPTDIKSSPKIDFPTDLNILALKNKLNFPVPDLNFSKSHKSDFSLSDLSNMSANFMSMSKDFSVSDLSISSMKSLKSDYSLNLSKCSTSDVLERPAKIPKTDYSLDLSQKTASNIFPNLSKDPILGPTGEEPSTSPNITSDHQGDQPLNLHNDTIINN